MNVLMQTGFYRLLQITFLYEPPCDSRMHVPIERRETGEIETRGNCDLLVEWIE